MQESPLIGRHRLADHVDRRGPCHRVGALRNHDGVGGRQRHVLPGPLGRSQCVDRHELAGQLRDARLQSPIVEDRPARQMCHEERWIPAMRGGRISRDQSGGRHAGPREQGQGASLRVQRILGVLHVERVDVAPQHQVTGAAVPRGRGQPPHFGSDAAVQHLGPDDSFADLQVLVHPSQCQRSDGRHLIVVGHRATSSSGRRYGQRLCRTRCPCCSVGASPNSLLSHLRTPPQSQQMGGCEAARQPTTSISVRRESRDPGRQNATDRPAEALNASQTTDVRTCAPRGPGVSRATHSAGSRIGERNASN